MKYLIFLFGYLTFFATQANSEEYLAEKIIEPLIRESPKLALKRYVQDSANNQNALEEWKRKFASATLAKIESSIRKAKWCSKEAKQVSRAPFFTDLFTYRSISFLSQVPNQWESSLDTTKNIKILNRLIDCSLNVESIYWVDKRGDISRVYLRVIENFAANYEKSYFYALTGNSTCDGLKNKIKVRRKVKQMFPHSRYAPRALLLQTYSSIELALNMDCKLNNEKRKEILTNQVNQINTAFENKMFKKSLDGWRYVNDVAFFRIALLMLVGNIRDSETEIKKFKKSSILLNSPLKPSPKDFLETSLYGKLASDQIHIATRKLMPIRIHREYSKEYLPFSDRVYIFNFLPGIDATKIKKSFSMKQLGKLLSKAHGKLQKNNKIQENAKILTNVFANQSPVDWKVLVSKLQNYKLSKDKLSKELTENDCNKEIERLKFDTTCTEIPRKSAAKQFYVENLSEEQTKQIKDSFPKWDVTIHQPKHLPAL